VHAQLRSEAELRVNRVTRRSASGASVRDGYGCVHAQLRSEAELRISNARYRAGRMGIVDEDVERVRQQTDIQAVIGEHVGLRKQGARWVGLCPFHAEKSPSFSVNTELGVYYCFGCQAKGDVITFVREVQHLDFVGAVESLAARAGVTLRYDSTQETGRRHRRTVLVEAMAAAVEWYHDRLLNSPDAAKARSYLRSRGYDGEAVRRYRMGWAPDDWDALARSLKVDADVLRDTGLAFVNSRNRLQDSFRGRVLFPIIDTRGDAVALGGRILPGSTDPAKYKNSPSTTIYDKSEILYGLNWAKGPIVARGEVVVCEGYTDVIGMAQAEVDWAVATCGTALTDRHVAMLKNFSRRIVLAFDADAAGQGAAERFYEWERRHDVDVYVAALPQGADPADLARTDPEALRRSVAEARPFLAFRLDRYLAAANLTTPEGRARAAEGAMAIIAEHPSDLVRDQYVMQIADRTRVDPSRLRAGAADARHRAAPLPTSRVSPKRRDGPSLLVLRHAVQDPASVAAFLDEVLFVEPVELAAYRALAAATTLHEAVTNAEPEAAELLQRLAVEEIDTEAEEVVASLVSEVALHVRREIEAEARASADQLGASDVIAWIWLRVQELRASETRRGALEQLVPFLAARAEEGP
jgi:DNA primase